MAIKPNKDKPVSDNLRPSGKGKYGIEGNTDEQFGHKLESRFGNPEGKKDEK